MATEENKEDDSEKGEEVPDIIMEDIEDLNKNIETPLRRVAEKFNFPLQDDDYKDLSKLGLRFESIEGAGGLSLPQLGINKRAFIFEIKKVEAAGTETKKDGEPTPEELAEMMGEMDLKKEIQLDPNVIWRKTLWINPSYTIPKDALLNEEYESCLSLKSEENFAAGPVFRLDRINYRAFDSQGRIYEGQAEGLVARVIQHEIDHLDGKLFTDYVEPERVMKLVEYHEKSISGQLPQLQQGIVPQFQN